MRHDRLGVCQEGFSAQLRAQDNMHQLGRHCSASRRGRQPVSPQAFRYLRQAAENLPGERKVIRFVPANAASTAEQLKIKLEGIEDAFGFIEHQQFLPGLRDPIRTEVMKAGKATVTASKKYVTELEAINVKDTLTPLTRGIPSCLMEEFWCFWCRTIL